MALDAAAPHGTGMDRGAIGGLVHAQAQAAQAGGHGRQAVGFLDPQFGGTAHHGRALRAGCGHEQRRELVDHVRHQVFRHLDAMQRRMPHHQVGDRFATVDGRVLLDDVRTHQPQRLQQAGAARIEPDRAQTQLRAGHDAGGDQEERGRGKIRRHRHVGGAQALAAAQPGEAGRELDLHTEGREHALGVVAGRVRFGHRGFAARVQAGQQDRRLHLGTGHRQRVVDACQHLSAMDVQRWGTVVAGVDPRAHPCQRSGDPAHRPL